MFSANRSFFHKVGHVGDCLNSFSKSHIIGKDSVHFFEGKLNHPDQGFLLVVFELASFEGFRLGFAEGLLEFL